MNFVMEKSPYGRNQSGVPRFLAFLKMRGLSVAQQCQIRLCIREHGTGGKAAHDDGTGLNYSFQQVLQRPDAVYAMGFGRN